MKREAVPQESSTAPYRVDMDSTASEFEDFIYLFSHDVRNSVRALIELPQWVQEDLVEAGVKIDGPVADSLDLMNRHMGRLDRMLVDLLTFSRAGKAGGASDFHVKAALTDVLEEMRIPSGFDVCLDVDCDVPFIGEGDGFTLLTQLISNAVKHHDKPDGSILIEVRDLPDVVSLRVSDDGPGIAPQYRDRVFAAMTTLRPRDEVEGSGMGLAIVRKIAQQYGGQILIGDGLNGRGVSVEVLLPRLDASPSLG